MISLGVIGECMLEFRGQAGDYKLGYGGDVFNTAVYASRLGLDVSFFSMTGDDIFSRYLFDAWENEGVAINTVRIDPALTPSLYIIKTDDAGERSFHYWREASPFKKWLQPGDYLDQLPDMFAVHQCLYFSGITLALLNEEHKHLLIELLAAYRKAGGVVGFDPNYRPALWSSSDEAIKWIDRAYAISDMALPSYDDEALLRQEDSQANLLAHIIDLGVQEIIMKDGPAGATVYFEGQSQFVAADTVAQVVDTTAAGDSFNGAYLATRLKQGTPTVSAGNGCKAAANVIQHRGAIISADVELLG